MPSAHRKNLAQNENIDIWKKDEDLQKFLKQTYQKMSDQNHTHERGAVGARAYFIPHVMEDGTILIEARTPSPRNKQKNPTLGLALIEAGSDLEKEVSQRVSHGLSQCL